MQRGRSITPTASLVPIKKAEEGDGGSELRTIAGSRSTATRATANEGHDRTPFDIFEPFRILRRRKLCLFVSVPVSLVLAVLASMLIPAKYTAVSRLQLVTEQTGRLSVGDSASANAEVFDSFATLQTDVTLMQSEMLALQVIRELKLADMKEFAYNPRFQTAEGHRQMALPIEQAPLKRAAILSKFESGLSVDILPGARLIAVSYSNSNPELAAMITNRLVSDFVDYDNQVRYNATIRATTFLRRQLAELKSEVEQSQQRAVALQKASGLFGTDQTHSLIDSGLEQLSKEVITAEANRVTKQTIYNMMRSGELDAITDLVGASSNSGSSQQAQNVAPLLTHLRQQLNDLNVEYAQAETEYGAAHPHLIQMKEQRQALQSSLQTELGKVLEGAKNEYELARSQEDTARIRLAQQEAVASRMNDQAITYNMAKNEADSSRLLYDTLLRKLKEAELLAGLQSSRLNVVDSAAVPGNLSKPKLRTFLILGLLGGVFVGVLAAFVLEATDHRIRSLHEIENATQSALLGVIPQHDLSRLSEPERILNAYATNGGSRVLASMVGAPSRNENDVAEAFRWVRTSLVLQGRGGVPRTLMISSASANEGKSFTALNLAAVLTETGKKVLLVDADLRRGNLSNILDRQAKKGLSEVLTGVVDQLPCDHVIAVNGLSFMPAGALVNSPVDLLASNRMIELLEEWRREFEHIVIDTPPLLPVVDALVLCQRVDTVIVVARSAFTQRASISRAIRLLRSAEVTSIHVLANAFETCSAEYSQFYGRYESVTS